MHRPTTIHPAPMPASLRSALGAALDEAHRDTPFLPDDVRDAARRVVEVARSLGLRPTVLRGGVDLGGAELDHVFVVVEDRVVDVAMPMQHRGFVLAARAWVAGDIELAELAEAAAPHGFEERVLGEYPSELRYRGAPVWGSHAA